MPDNDRPKSSHEIAQGLGALLATREAPARAEEPADEPVVEDTDVPEIEDDGEEQEVETDEEPEATEVEEFALDLKVNGVDYRITDRAEATKLAQLGKHFTQKNEALIQREQAFEAERQSVTEVRQRYAEALPQIEAYLANPLGEPPAEKDFKDRASYLEAKDAYSETLGKVQAVRAEMQRVQAEQAEEHQRQLAKWAEAEEQHTLAAIPEWIDAHTRQTDVQQMQEYAHGIGMPQQVLQSPQLVHATWFRVLLRDAARYQKSAERGSTEVKKVQTKEAAPGTGSEARTQGKSKRLREHRQRIKNSGGRVEEAAPVMDALLQRQRQLTKR